MELFNYLLKVSACSVLFFAFYLLVLRKLTFFRINRFYLLFSVLLSFMIPALQITIEREAVAPSNVITGTIVNESLTTNEIISETPITVESLTTSFTGNVNWITLLPYLYGVVVLSLLLLAAWRIYRLIKHTKASVKEINGLKLVTKQRGFTNCSFFNYVFIDEQSLTESELAVLLAHEEVHAKQYHSIDKLLLMIAKAFLWFNPVIYLYDKALEQTHEYEADESTSENIGTDIYAALLLKLAISKNSNPLIHNFVKSPIKQRIKMLFNSKSKNMKKLAYLIILPIGLCLIWSFTIKVVYIESLTKKAENFMVKKPISIKASPDNVAEKNVSSLKPEVVDTIRLVGSSSLGKNPKVIIDGKSYSANILTKLSPNSVRSTFTVGDSINITTKNNEIEYATDIEIENVKIANAIDNRSLYTRYSQRDKDGGEFEIIKTHQPRGSTIYKIAKGDRVAIYIYGKMYTEAEAKMLKPDLLANHKGMSFYRKGERNFETLFPQHMDDYDAVLNILGNPPTEN